MKKVLLLFAALAVVGGPVHAQESDPAAAEPATGAAEPTSGEEQDAALADDSATEAEKELERDLALFWGNRREVKVVQKRLVEKDGRFELAPYGSIIPNDDFIVYFPVGLRAGYHISEAFSVELSFAYAIDSQTDLASFLENEIDLKRADLQEILKMYYNANVLWSPIYGKISLLGLKLTHFETFVGLGFGLMHKDEYEADNPEAQAVIKPAGNTVLGFRWFINDYLNIRTEYRHYFFEKAGGGVSIPVELSLGLGVMI